MTVEACAKVNLTLEVYGIRPDGFHELRSVVLPIPLADTLEISEASTLSTDTGFANDLILKAGRALDSRRGATFRVTKHIPVGGGLGGGSADAAAALIALNQLWTLGYAVEELAEIGAKVGSDVPALVMTQALHVPVLMEGRGERVTPLSPLLAPLPLMIGYPNVSVSTAEVYAACIARSPNSPSATDRMIAALKTGELAQIAAIAANDLQSPAVRLHPEIAVEMEKLSRAGALGVRMSGSGSTVFGFDPNLPQA